MWRFVVGYPTSQRNIPEDFSLQQLNYENLKPRVSAKVIGCYLMAAVFDAGVLDMLCFASDLMDVF